MADEETLGVKTKFTTEGDKDVIGAYERLKERIEANKKAVETFNAAQIKIRQDNKIQELTRFYADLATKLNDDALAANRLAKELVAIGATTDQIEDAAAAFERMRTAQTAAQSGGSSGGGVNFGAIGRAAGGLGLSGVSDVSNTVDDVKDLFDQFKANKDIIPGVAAASTALTPALGATAAGFVAVAAPLAVVAAIAIPIAIGIKNVSDELERSRKAYADELNALKEATDQRIANNALSRTRTAEQNRQEAADIQFAFDEKKKLLDQQIAQRADLDRQYAELGSSFNPTKRQDLYNKGQDANKAIDETVKELTELQKQLDNTVKVLGPTIDQREAEQKAIEEANKATNTRAALITQNAQIETKVYQEIQNLTRDQAEARIAAIEREKSAIQDQITELSALPNRTGEVTKKIQDLGTQFDALKREGEGLSGTLNNLPTELKNATSELAKLTDQITDIESKRSEQLANRAQEDKRAGEIAELEIKIKKAQNDEAAVASRDKIARIRAEGGDADAVAIVKQNERIQAINDQFFANQMKSWNAYYKTEIQETAKHNVDRLRQLEDLNSSLLNLSANRDVAGFVNARAAGFTSLKRGDEDASSASRQRLQNYQDQAAEADAARRKQLEDLRLSNEKENTERRKQLQAKVDAEIAAGQGQLKESEKLQQQLATLRQHYAAEDIAARRRNEDEAYNAQIGKLRSRQTELNNIVGRSLDPAKTAITNIGNAVIDFVNRLRAAASAPAARISNNADYAARPGQSVIARYDIGTRRVPQTGLYHLREGEGVLTQAENSQRGYTPAWSKGNSNPTYIVNNPQFGALVTPAEMDAQFRMMFQSIGNYSGAPTN